jgi:adenylate kinase
LTAPDEVLLERMLARGRADDTVEAISRRLAIYHRETTPLIDYYDDRVVHVDGVGTVDEVHERILAAVRAALDAQDPGDAEAHSA